MVFKIISGTIGLAHQTVSTGVYSAVKYATNDKSQEAEDLSNGQKKELKLRFKDLSTFYIPGKTCRKCGKRTKDGIRRSSRRDRRCGLVAEYCNSCNEANYYSRNQMNMGVHGDVPINYSNANVNPAAVAPASEPEEELHHDQSDDEVLPSYETTFGNSTGNAQQRIRSGYRSTDCKKGN
ncbi:hypothetical protein B5S31_g3606 [[Candida] boidinii]|nr:hypothetical protein B5S31_g3606 [[Candida] boidinii]